MLWYWKVWWQTENLSVFTCKLEWKSRQNSELFEKAWVELVWSRYLNHRGSVEDVDNFLQKRISSGKSFDAVGFESFIICVGIIFDPVVIV